MSFEINGSPIEQVNLRMRRIGAWDADVFLPAAASPITGKVTVSVGDLTLQGFSFRGGITQETNRIRIVGGAGGLQQVVPAKAYVQPPASLVLTDLCKAAGETLAQSTPAESFGSFPFWVRLSQPLADALRVSASKLGVSWRVLADGTIWLGPETWPDVTSSFSGEMVKDEPEAGRTTYGVDRPSLTPGVSLSGAATPDGLSRRVSVVQHVCTSDRIRSTVWWEDAAS